MNTPIPQAARGHQIEAAPFEAALTPESLSALMRSTWTWDDRALRRDLAALLVDLDAAHAVAAMFPTFDGLADVLRARALSSAADFVASVLGPTLIVDTGSPLRPGLLGAAIDPASFDRAASRALAAAKDVAGEYITACVDSVEYPSESSWLKLVADSGRSGLGSAMRAYGNQLGESGFYASMGLAWQALQIASDDSPKAAELAKRIANGDISATLAVAEREGSWDPALVRTKAVLGPDGWQLTGLKQFVPAADSAEQLLVIARSLAGPSLFAVSRSALGLNVTALAGIDPTRPLFQVTFADTPAVLIGTEGGGGRLMARTIDAATTATAAEQVGLIEKSISLLAHRDVEGSELPYAENTLAELALDHAVAVSLWQRAMAEDDAESPDASAAAAANIGCSAASLRAAKSAAQLLGPSEQTDAMLRRALSASLLFGGPAVYYERLLERLGI